VLSGVARRGERWRRPHRVRPNAAILHPEPRAVNERRLLIAVCLFVLAVAAFVAICARGV
jgi:hypothetical protein